jgi:SAM-dependent methyltransferase
MSNDATVLRDFYASPLGLVTARLVGGRLAALTPDLKGCTVLGLGYAAPYLNYLRFSNGRAPARVLAFMPGSCGVHPWPATGRNAAALVEETSLPLPDASVDLVVMTHFLEHCDNLKAVLREVWRVLVDGGRLIAVTPNRGGPWTYYERTPFGHGRPYSKGQLDRLLRGNLFTPCRSSAALFLPPQQSAVGLYMMTALDNIGWRWWRRFGGVVMCEAEKRVYALNGPQTEPKRARALAAPAGSSFSASNGS